MSKADEEDHFQALLTKRQIPLLMSSIEIEWEGVSFSFPTTHEGRKTSKIVFGEKKKKKREKFCMKYF